MRNTLIFSTLLLGSIIAGQAWSHHAAEGIVSDEIWQMIDYQLTTVDSPHLDIDFDDIMGSMRVYEADEGDLYLLTSVVAYPLDVDDYELALDQAEEFAGNALTDVNQVPSGSTNSGNASVAWFEILEPGDYEIEILIFEPIGFGNSQTGEDPGNEPNDEAPGEQQTGEDPAGERAAGDPAGSEQTGNTGKGG